MTEIKPLALAITDPEDFYQGVASGNLTTAMPDNMLVFTRTEGRKMRQRRGNVHHRFLLVIAVEGSGSGYVNGQRFPILEGQAMLVFPQQFHHFVHDQPEICWIMITFEMPDLECFVELQNAVLNLSEDANLYLQLLLNRYLTIGEPSHATGNRCLLMLRLLLESLTECKAEAITVSNDPLTREDPALTVIDRINKHIDRNLAMNLTIAGLAAKFAYSASHLRLLYRRKMGISIGSYIKNMRMQRAKSHLVSSAKPIGEIAESCGYDTLYAFSRAFSKHVGIPPREYRRKFQRP